MKKFEAVLGKRLSNILQALLFALPHFGVAYTNQFNGNAGITLDKFIIGLFMGYLKRKTDSLLSPWLVHAALDLIVWLGIVAGL